jgi:nucleoside-diphosphate-sugar epimerase
MKVFVAGGSGTIGAPLVRALVQAGHAVFATTRTPAKQSMISALGATPVIVDALDADALERAVTSAAPTHVIHQLTALPKAGVRRAADLEGTNRLREEGTTNLLRAAIAAGASRIIAGSFAMFGNPSSVVNSAASTKRAAEAVRSMESQILEASRNGAIEGIILRYGLFYGPDNPATEEMIAMVRRRRLPRLRHDRGRLPFIHVEDAVAATVAALDKGAAGSIFDIVDDHPASFSEMVTFMAEVAGAPRPLSVPEWLLRVIAPYLARLLTLDVRLSNQKAKRELRWMPMFPSYREGLRETFAHAA